MELEYGRLVLYRGILADYLERNVCWFLHWSDLSRHIP